MTTSNAVDALRRNRADVSATKQRAVLDAIDRLTVQGGEVSVSTVARAAGVSRQFLYSHRALRDAVTKAGHSSRGVPAGTVTGREMASGLRADRRLLSAKVERQAVTIAELTEQLDLLERQRQRWLGSQLGTGTVIDPEAHAELRITNERLVAENTALNAQVTELRRINTVLEADLAASRQAHSEDIANLARNPAQVTAIAASR